MFEGDYDDTGGNGSFQLRPGEYSVGLLQVWSLDPGVLTDQYFGSILVS